MPATLTNSGVTRSQIHDAAARSIAKLWMLAAADPFSKLLSMTDANKQEIRTVSLTAATRAAAAYQTAGVRFTDHLGAVIKNNPGKSFQDIVGRADVQLALHDNLAKAQAKVADELRSAFEAGGKLGLKHAAKELTTIGMGMPSIELGTEPHYLGRLLGDLQKNADVAAARFLARAQAGFEAAVPKPSYQEHSKGVTNVPKALATDRAQLAREELAKVSADLARRASAGASVAATRAYNDAKLAAFQSSGTTAVKVDKIWITNFGPNTCAVCAALHGTVVESTIEFNPNATFSAGGKAPKVYENLQTPPRHPHCNCVILPFISGIADGGGPTPDTLKAKAQQLASDAKGMVPVSFPADTLSATSRTTGYLTADDMRAISNTHFEAALQQFKACVVSKQKK